MIIKFGNMIIKTDIFIKKSNNINADTVGGNVIIQK